MEKVLSKKRPSVVYIFEHELRCIKREEAIEFLTFQEKINFSKLFQTRKKTKRTKKQKKKYTDQEIKEMAAFCIGYKIKEMRFKAKKTQKEMSDFLNVTISKVRQMERGYIKSSQIPELCRFLNASFEDKYFFFAPYIITLENCQNLREPTDSFEEAYFLRY